jgi:signal transduction histidine kinase
MRAALDFLAGRRWAGVGFALLTEISLLVVLALAPTSAVVGIPAAVAASIAGTVAVVFGVVDGAAVALAGALVFAALGGWEPGELAALAVWPGIVAAAGVFARRVERHRAALRRLVGAHEEQQRTVALALHDESAQVLSAALMTMRATEGDGAGQARELITKTIQELRELAGDLSPKALEDYGLSPALARLAKVVSERAKVDVHVSGDWNGRLTDEAERALFRVAQAAVRGALERGAGSVEIALNAERDQVILEVAEQGGWQLDEEPLPPEPTSEHLRLLGGRLGMKHSHRGLVLRAELPSLTFVR